MPSVLAERLDDRIDAIIDVDTHTDTHTAAVVSPVGSVLAEITVSATADGAASLLAWAGEHTDRLGTGRRAWASDSAPSHGVGLLRALRTADETVFEASKPTSTSRRRGGKSDSLDAVHAARAVLAADYTATPRADGDREALRILHACRRHYTDARTATVNLFKSLILTADDELREQFRGRNTDQQVRHAADLTAGEDTDALARLRRDQMTALANHIRDLDRLLATNLRQIRDLVTAMCSTLLEQPGIGPVTAAVALISWSHHGRVRSEAAFAALAGVSPVPASSGPH